MLYFPQMSSGALSQYPIHKRRISRTVRNQCADGREIRFPDSGGATIEWQLRFAELTDDELTTLQSFFEKVEGRLMTFTFLDPTDNLTEWSENFDEPVWQRDAMLSVTAGASDPFGTMRASRIQNVSGAALRMVQTLPVPAWFSFCLSVYVRSDQHTTVSLVRGTEKLQCLTGPEWKRLLCSGHSQGTAESMEFGIELAPATQLELFGMQVEPQVGASTYKKTLSKGGIYQGARFRHDSLAVTTLGPARHVCTVNVIHANTL